MSTSESFSSFIDAFTRSTGSSVSVEVPTLLVPKMAALPMRPNGFGPCGETVRGGRVAARPRRVHLDRDGWSEPSHESMLSALFGLGTCGTEDGWEDLAETRPGQWPAGDPGWGQRPADVVATAPLRPVAARAPAEPKPLPPAPRRPQGAFTPLRGSSAPPPLVAHPTGSPSPEPTPRAAPRRSGGSWYRPLALVLLASIFGIGVGLAFVHWQGAFAHDDELRVADAPVITVIEGGGDSSRRAAVPRITLGAFKVSPQPEKRARRARRTAKRARRGSRSKAGVDEILAAGVMGAAAEPPAPAAEKAPVVEKAPVAEKAPEAKKQRRPQPPRIKLSRAERTSAGLDEDEREDPALIDIY